MAFHLNEIAKKNTLYKWKIEKETGKLGNELLNYAQALIPKKY